MTTFNTLLPKELGIIEIHGADANTFLQGQLTNDVSILHPPCVQEHSITNTAATLQANAVILKGNLYKQNDNYQFSAYLNNKGRVIATFVLCCIKENHYYLVLSSDVRETVLKRLKMYVLRSKVSMRLKDCQIYFSNNILNIQNYSHVIRLPQDYYLAILDDNQDSCVNNDQQNEHNEANSTSLDSSDLSNGCAPIHEVNAWHYYLVNNGIAFICDHTKELLTIQEINFDLLGGVSFTKGCYIGQEIVSRMHYLGKAKKRMFQCMADAPIFSGELIVSPKINNQEIGIVIDAVKRQFGILGLVSLRVDCQDEAFINSEKQQQLLIQTIQY